MKTSGLILPENCNLHFHANGIIVRVSLNIPRNLVSKFDKQRIFKGNDMFVYSIEKELEWEYCSPKNITQVYNLLVTRAMKNIRGKKIQKIKEEVTNLKKVEKQLKLELR